MDATIAEKIAARTLEQIVARIVTDGPSVERAVQAAVAQARLKDAKRESIPDLQLRAGELYNGERVGTTSVSYALKTEQSETTVHASLKCVLRWGAASTHS